MLVGVMFYQFGEKQSDIVKFGFFCFSVNQIIIGVESVLIVVLLNLFIVIIFRNIKFLYNYMKIFYQSDKIVEWYIVELYGNKKVKIFGCFFYFFEYIVWLFCIFVFLMVGIFIIFYSVQWGKEILR